MASQAERLKPYAIDVKSPVDPVDWFLAGKDDVRSSYYLEDVATEFHVQGLEYEVTHKPHSGFARPHLGDFR